MTDDDVTDTEDELLNMPKVIILEIHNTWNTN